MWHVKRIFWSWELILWEIGIHIEKRQSNKDLDR